MKTFFSSLGVKMAAATVCVAAMGSVVAGEAVSPTHPVLYAEVGAGGYYRNMRDDSVIGAQNKVSKWKQGRMGWQAGFDLGYRFWKDIAGEFGFFWIQNQKMTFRAAKTYGGVSFANGSTIELKSWAIYLAARADFEVALDWDIYGKLGLAYEHNRLDYRPLNSADQRGRGSLWSPLFGFGVVYHLSKHWFLGADYALIIGNSANDDPYYSSRLTGSDVHIPPLQRITVNVGYWFQI
jgi:hypothetical protein